MTTRGSGRVKSQLTIQQIRGKKNKNPEFRIDETIFSTENALWTR
jgi:hypothetical protein